jgi:hypothetical protein
MRLTQLLLPLSCFLLGHLSAGSILAVQAEQRLQLEGAGPITEQTAYYATPGEAEKVYAHRLHASEVRKKIGLPAGRVLRKAGGDGRLADVIWQLEYPDQKALERDLNARAESREFEQVRATMKTLIDDFSRGFYR